MQVLLVANGYPPYAHGGVETYTAGLAEQLRSRGHKLFVICAESKPDAADCELLEEDHGGIKLFRLVNDFKRIESFDDTFVDRRIDETFGRLLDRLQPDLVHFNHLIKLSARLPLIARSRGIPSLFTAHDFWPLCQRIYLHDWRKRACPGPIHGGDCYACITAATPADRARTFTISKLRNRVPYRVRQLLRNALTTADYFLPQMQPAPDGLNRRYELFREALQAARTVTVPSQFVKQMFVDNGYRDEHIEVLPLGISAPKTTVTRQVRQEQGLKIAFVGAILPWKGTEVLVRAFRESKPPDLRLTFHGREDIVPAFTRSLRHLAAADRRITFDGPFEAAQKDEAYRDMDVLVIPSIAHESFSLVAREALVRGVPVIAADSGALPEVVKDGVNGFLVPPGNVQVLSALFTRLADHPELLSSLQTPGPVTILSVDQHVDRLLDIYETCRALPS